MEEFQSASRQYNNVHSRLVAMRKELYRMEMVIDELKTPPKNTYVTIGKAFVQSNYEELNSNVKNKHDELDRDIKKLEPMDKALAEKVNTAHANLVKSMKVQQKE
ncbi:Prefoldin subunit [Entamoeba marina]